jgi:thiol:disulfide interchange protein DsbC
MDKAEAWTNLMVKNIEPDKASCDNPINKNESLADKLGVSGTPTVYLSNGQQSQNPQELIAAIKASNKKK